MELWEKTERRKGKDFIEMFMFRVLMHNCLYLHYHAQLAQRASMKEGRKEGRKGGREGGREGREGGREEGRKEGRKEE